MGGIAGSGDCRQRVKDACREGGNKDSRSHAQGLRDHGGDHPAVVTSAIALSNAACFERHREEEVHLSGWPRQVIVKKWLTPCSRSMTTVLGRHSDLWGTAGGRTKGARSVDHPTTLFALGQQTRRQTQFSSKEPNHSATAVLSQDDFASRLERCTERGGRVIGAFRIPRLHGHAVFLAADMRTWPQKQTRLICDRRGDRCYPAASRRFSLNSSSCSAILALSARSSRSARSL